LLHNKNIMGRNFIKLLADLRFAIIILLLIASFSIIGTIIEQNQSTEVYQLNYPLETPIWGFLSWKLILFFGFDHIYTTPWFLVLILILGFSLITCTILQQLPSFKISKRCQFFRTPGQFKRLKIKNKISNKFLSNFIFKLNHLKYSIFQQQEIIYSYKGLIGRVAPILVHGSLILILIGAILGSLGGFNSQELISKSQSFTIQNIINRGQFTKIPNITTRVNDFWITYTKQTTVNQFYSDLSFLDNSGKEVKHKIISVNHPLIYKDITFYQTDWDLSGIRLKLNSNLILQYPLVLGTNNPKTKVWVTWVPFTNDSSDGVVVLVNNLHGYISIYDKSGQFLNNLQVNENINLENPIGLIDIITLTGLQIKADPGITIIYTGFGFLMISTLISYVTYSQIWVILNKNEIFIGGNTNRAKFDFELEFQKILNKKRL
jgi:cytochrome c biogenesis protein